MVDPVGPWIGLLVSGAVWLHMSQLAVLSGISSFKIKKVASQHLPSFRETGPGPKYCIIWNFRLTRSVWVS